MRPLLTHALREDSGQDLIEYALLSGVITAAGVALFPAISQAMADAYTRWQSEAQIAWEPCPPLPAACP